MFKIVIRDLTKTYSGGGVVALQDINLEVQPDESLCILGPSGCGKTTLLRILDCLISQDRGQILVDGHAVTQPRPDVAMVFQHFGLFPWKRLDENIAYGLELRGSPRQEVTATVERYIQLMGLKGFERSYPYQLSGGMQQRAGLARALALEPDVLLMDEPFGSLDAQTREILQDELLQILQTAGARGGRVPSTVFITHSIEEAIALGDRIVVLTARPARVRDTILVDIPRPRTVASVVAHPRFVELHDHCWRLLRERLVA